MTMKTFLKFYEALGNNKAQRFRRLMYILLLISGLTTYGFYCGALKINFGKASEMIEK